jgi:large subunit ribosomal protein L10
MSKTVKRYVTRDIQSRLDGVKDAVLVDVVGLDGNTNCELRKAFREKGISVLVVKRTLAARATDGTTLRPAFGEMSGSIAVAFGCEDFVSLAKEITGVVDSGTYKGLAIKGGVMDDEALTAEQVKDVSKWPSRREQISMLVGQILGPGSKLSAQLKGAGGKLAAQLKTIIEKQEESASA